MCWKPHYLLNFASIGKGELWSVTKKSAKKHSFSTNFHQNAEALLLSLFLAIKPVTIEFRAFFISKSEYQYKPPCSHSILREIGETGFLIAQSV